MTNALHYTPHSGTIRIKGERVEERMVTTGQKVGDATEIVNGVAEGDQVAETNVGRLVDGARVRVGRVAGVSTASNPSPKTRQED